MNLTQISVRNSVFAWMLMASLVLFGLISVKKMGISEMPDVDFPVVNISVTYEGASPAVMETDIVDIIEEAVISVEGVRNVESSSKQAEANITVEFDIDRDIDEALNEIQTKIAQAQKKLPDEMDPPVITKTNPEDQPIMWVALSGDSSTRDLMTLARNRVKDQFQTVAGVGEIVLSGFIDPVLRVWVDNKKLEQYELTIQDVLNAIGDQHAEIPAGRLENDKTEINIRTYGEAKSPEEFGNILILKRGGQTNYSRIKLGDIATIEPGLDDIRRISRSNGKAAVGMGIKKIRGSNAVELSDNIRKRIVEVSKTLPEGMRLWVNFDSTDFIRHAIADMKTDLILSVVLTSFVCLFFLGSFGSTFNILLAIPTSIIGTFIALHFFGFTLNTFTLLALILCIGIVVDDAIMVLENIFRHRQMGKSVIEAALDGAKQITSAAIATTLSLVAIFMPVVFMEGTIGRFFFQFGVTITVAVLISLLEALTLTPMRASRFEPKDNWASRLNNKFERKAEHFFGGIAKLYEKLLIPCLNHRALTIGLSIIFFAVSLISFKFVGKEFIPAQDQSGFLIRFQTPLGSSINYTDEKMKEAEAMVSADPNVLRYFVAVGGFGGGEVNTGMMFVTLKNPKERPKEATRGKRLSQKEIMDVMREKLKTIKDLRPALQDLSGRGFTAKRSFPIEFTVRGPDWATLVKSSQELVTQMRQNPQFVDVETDYLEGQPEWRIYPDRNKAFERGVSVEVIAQTIQALVGGIKWGKITEEGRRNDIRIRLGEKQRQTTDILDSLWVRNQNGELIPLHEVVTSEVKPTLKSITRKGRERAITLQANIGNGFTQQTAIEEINRLGKSILPEDYRLVAGGTSEAFADSFKSLFFVLFLGLIVSYMVLASQYNSFIHPLTVLIALPYSISGAFLALWAFHSTLNIYSFIGIILLMGLVKKNSIMLVDFTNQMRDEGLNVRDALINACPTRLRPILMTSIATMAAALPPALALGQGSETRQPMAIVVIGGVLVSTILTLFVIPCVYSLFAKLEKKRQIV